MKIVEISCACGNRETMSEKFFKEQIRGAARKLGFMNFVPAGFLEFWCPKCGQYAMCLTKNEGD